MPAPLLCPLLLALVAAVAAGGDGGGADAAEGGAPPERIEPLVHDMATGAEFEQFLQLHKPGLGKVLFFSKLGKSDLCTQLGEHFDGRLDVLHVPPSATEIVQQFSIEEAPAVFVLPAESLNSPPPDDPAAAAAGQTLQLMRYEGDFKFGALDRLKTFLEPFAPAVPELPLISSQGEFVEACEGPLPCIVLFIEGARLPAPPRAPLPSPPRAPPVAADPGAWAGLWAQRRARSTRRACCRPWPSSLRGTSSSSSASTPRSGRHPSARCRSPPPPRCLSDRLVWIRLATLQR